MNSVQVVRFCEFKRQNWHRAEENGLQANTHSLHKHICCPIGMFTSSCTAHLPQKVLVNLYFYCISVRHITDDIFCLLCKVWSSDSCIHHSKTSLTRASLCRISTMWNAHISTSQLTSDNVCILVIASRYSESTSRNFELGVLPVPQTTYCRVTYHHWMLHKHQPMLTVLTQYTVLIYLWTLHLL